MVRGSKNRFFIVAVGIAIVISSSKVDAKEVPLSQCRLTSASVVDKLNMRALVGEVVEEICSKREVEDLGYENLEPIIVPDAVDSVDLEPGKIGILLGELTRERVANRCGLPIRQVEISKQLRLNLSGLTMLSRDPYRNQIKEVSAAEAIVGAFQLQQNRITLTIRRVRLEDSVIKNISSKELQWGCEKPLFREARLIQVIN